LTTLATPSLTAPLRFSVPQIEVREALDCPEAPKFPKYVAPLLNMANQFSQATRPRHVGQQSDLVREFDGETLIEYRAYYNKRHPKAVKQAAKKVHAMLRLMRQAINSVTPDMVERWVEDLVVDKSFVGLKAQDALVAMVAERLGEEWRASTAQEESQGIDAYIGERPVSVKPSTYRQTRAAKQEVIDADFLFYEKTTAGFEVDFEPKETKE
jgi:hypothetical protein